MTTTIFRLASRVSGTEPPGAGQAALPAGSLPTENGGDRASDDESTVRTLLQRMGVGLGLCSLYGVALGCREGGLALLQHAVGVPLGVVLAVLVGAPSMYVFLSLCRAPIDARSLTGIAARGIASAGVLLAGLAPAAALFVVSSETAGAAAGAVTLGLVLGGGVALMGMLWHVLVVALSGSAKSQLGGLVIALGFAVFAISLAVRIWGVLLPVLGGGA